MKKNFDFLQPFLTPLVLIGVGGVVLNSTLWLLSFLLFPRELPAAILHYNVGIGIDFIGEGGEILMLPVIGAALLVLDGMLAYALRKIHYLSATILMGTALVAQILLLAAFSAILIMNQ